MSYDQECVLGALFNAFIINVSLMLFLDVLVGH